MFVYYYFFFINVPFMKSYLRVLLSIHFVVEEKLNGANF